MRRKKLKAYWARLKELQKREKLTRDELLLAPEEIQRRAEAAVPKAAAALTPS